MNGDIRNSRETKRQSLDRAIVYRRGARLAVAPKSQVGHGSWITLAPIFSTCNETDASEIRRYIMRALDVSGARPPEKTSETRLFQSVVDVFGETSYSGFVNGMTGFSVERAATTYCITPLKNRGPAYGFFYDRDRQIEVEVGTPAGSAKLERAIKQCFDSC